MLKTQASEFVVDVLAVPDADDEDGAGLVVWLVDDHLTESTYARYAISSQADLEAGVAKIVAFRAARAAKQG